MKAIKAKEKGFTHHAQMYGITGYSKYEDYEGMAFRAKYWITDKIVDALVFLDSKIGFSKEGFMVKIYSHL